MPAKQSSSNVTRLKPRGQNGAGNILNSITPAQRAAVIIAVLGESAARPIVERFDDSAMAQIATALETVNYLDREQLTEIVMDFLQHLRQTNGAFRGGKSRAREIVGTLIDQSRLDRVFGSGEALPAAEIDPGDTDVWGRLEQKDPAAIAEYLQTLTPNIAALILRKLDPPVASEVVDNLVEDSLDETIGFLVEVERPDPEIDAVIGRMIEIEFLNNSDEDEGEEDAGGNMEAVGEMLSLIPGAKRDRLLAFLKTDHEAKLEKIEKVLFTIDGLPAMLPRNSVPVVFKELGEDQIVPVLSTLTGELQPVADYLLSNISSRLAEQYRDAINDPNRKKVDDAEAVQRDFLMSLMGLKRRGLITMEKVVAAE
ncbi:MAG: FliG C-terminal domain-containing protein [Henriciella sp.]